MVSCLPKLRKFSYFSTRQAVEEGKRLGEQIRDCPVGWLFFMGENIFFDHILEPYFDHIQSIKEQNFCSKNYCAGTCKLTRIKLFSSNFRGCKGFTQIGASCDQNSKEEIFYQLISKNAKDSPKLQYVPLPQNNVSSNLRGRKGFTKTVVSKINL